MGAMSSNAALMANQSVSAFNESWHAHLGLSLYFLSLKTSLTSGWCFRSLAEQHKIGDR